MIRFANGKMDRMKIELSTPLVFGMEGKIKNLGVLDGSICLKFSHKTIGYLAFRTA